MDTKVAQENAGVSSEIALSETCRTLPIALVRTRERLLELYRPKIHEAGLTEQQWRVIRIINELSETDATTVARHACILPPSVSRMIKSLEQQDLIDTFHDPSDGRRTLIRLSKKGQDLIARVGPEMARIRRRIRDIVGPDQHEKLLNLLEQISSKLEDAILEDPRQPEKS